MKLVSILLIMISFVSLYCYQWPLSCSETPDDFTSAYGPRLNGGYDFHDGMDLSATMNTAVYPSHGGIVSYYTGTNSGICIIIENPLDDVSSIYAHLDQRLVPEGFIINDLTTQIGESGNSGSVPPHLHFGIADNDEWLAPETVPIHPLDKLPYTPDFYNPPYMTLSENSSDVEFTLDLHVQENLLNVTGIDLWLHWTDSLNPENDSLDEIYNIDYETGHNCPNEANTQNPDVGTIEIFEANRPGFENCHWSLDIWADDFNNSDPQIVHFKVYNQSQTNQYHCYYLGDRVCLAPDYETNWVEISIPPTDTESNVIPQTTELYQNFPNPFNPETTISYQIFDPDRDFKLEIFNIKGQEINSFDLNSRKGIGSVIWNGRNYNDNPVSSGIYLYRITADSKVIETRKMNLVK